MEAGVAVSARSSFRKPSHATSQRNYRRRSPSSSSRSPSASPSPPPQAPPSGGWKRDRSASPTSSKRDGATNAPLHSKKGKTIHPGKDGSDEDSQGRQGEPGPASSDRQARGASYDRYGKPDVYETRRSGASHYDRSYQAQGRYTSRDSYGDTRRNGDYDHSVRKRGSPDRGYMDSSRSRDRERYRSRDRDRGIDGNSKSWTGGRETNLERETYIEGKIEQDNWERDQDRDRNRNRNRNRDRSRGGRSSGRDSYYEKDDVERRYEGGRSRDSNRDRDRERVKSRHTVRELSVGREFEAGEIDSERSRERERERDRAKRRDNEKLQSKPDLRDLPNAKHLDRENTEWSGGGKGRESERDMLKDKAETSELNSDMDVATERDTWERTREGVKYRDRERVEDKRGRDFSSAEMDREQDVGRRREKSRGRDVDPPRDRANSKGPDRRKDRSRLADEGDYNRGREIKSKEQSKETSLQDEDEYRERSVHRDKEHFRVRDQAREKDDLGSLQEHHKSSNRYDIERSGKKVSSSSEQVSYQDRDRGNCSGRGKGSGEDRRLNDGARDKDKLVVKSEKENEQGVRAKKEVDGSYKSDVKNREDGKDQESAHQASSLVASASDLDTKGAAGSDGKASKGSKWGPEASDPTVKSSASEEVLNDLTAAKLAAMKAAELVNKNLGVAGFMSADQKKRLLWGSKKLAAEQPAAIQEPAVAAGTNRWDTVHFSDPDRQEKFQKLMGVKADTCPETKKEGDPEVSIFTEERQRELQQDLEKQFAAGLRRRDGGKVGLGL